MTLLPNKYWQFFDVETMLCIKYEVKTLERFSTTVPGVNLQFIPYAKFFISGNPVDTDCPLT